MCGTDPDTSFIQRVSNILVPHQYMYVFMSLLCHRKVLEEVNNGWNKHFCQSSSFFHDFIGSDSETDSHKMHVYHLHLGQFRASDCLYWSLLVVAFES